jgi:hypothetical protein
MKTGRQGAFLLLAMVVLWTALPASVCLLARHAMALPACCRAMRNCDSPAMGADHSCCRIHRGGDVAVVTILPYSHDDHAQQLITAPYLNAMTPFPARCSGSGNAFATPPPKFPPGGAFALRI